MVHMKKNLKKKKKNPKEQTWVHIEDSKFEIWSLLQSCPALYPIS